MKIAAGYSSACPVLQMRMLPLIAVLVTAGVCNPEVGSGAVGRGRASDAAAAAAAAAVPIRTNDIRKVIAVTDSRTVADETRALKKVFLANRSVTCNDGSQAG